MAEDVNANFLDADWWRTATVEDVKAEIAKGADVKAEDRFRGTALMLAAENNESPEIIRTLYELGADVNAKCWNWTPLMRAARENKNPEIIRTLVELGAKVDAKDENGSTALLYAVEHNKNPEIIRTLAERSADMNEQDELGKTILMFAAKYNEEPEIVRTFIKLGADVNIKDKFGKTALYYAKWNKNPEILKLLEKSTKPLDESQQIAFDKIKNNPHQNFFIQGEAGTGKSYLINYIKNNLGRKYAVIAPSGIAAELIGGSTIHSLFKLGAHDFFPKKKVDDYKNYDEVVPLIDTLIIDEVSMLRADLFDTIDDLCRKAKNNKEEAFGGIQIILVGDLRQLPPVYAYKKKHKDVNFDVITYDDIDEKDEQYKYITNTYKQVCPYFFDAKCYKNAEFEVIRLEINHRQDDKIFLEHLKHLGQGDKIDEALAYFNETEFCSSTNVSAPIITAYRKTAKQINADKLGELSGDIKEYKAILDGIYYDKNCVSNKVLEDRIEQQIVPAVLELKIGAKVMFCKNDNSENEAYVNGTIGIVKDLKEKSVVVDIPDKNITVEVGFEKWKKEQYEQIGETNTYKLVEKGSFSQIPLKLAYAITIHKSQGQTWNDVCIDLEQQSVFASGQMYVALSRVKTKDGIYLTRALTKDDIKVNPRVNEFLKNPEVIPLPDAIDNETIQQKKDYDTNEELRRMLRNTGLRDIYRTGSDARTKLINYLNNRYNLEISPVSFTGISRNENNKYLNYITTPMIALDWWLCLYDRDNETIRLYHIPPRTFGINAFPQINGKYCIEIVQENGNHVIKLKDDKTEDIEGYFKLVCDLKKEDEECDEHEDAEAEAEAEADEICMDTDDEITSHKIEYEELSQRTDSKIENQESLDNMEIIVGDLKNKYNELQQKLDNLVDREDRILVEIKTKLDVLEKRQSQVENILTQRQMEYEELSRKVDEKIEEMNNNERKSGEILKNIKEFSEDILGKNEEIQQRIDNLLKGQEQIICFLNSYKSDNKEEEKYVFSNDSKEDNASSYIYSSFQKSPSRQYIIKGRECSEKEFERYLQDSSQIVNRTLFYKDGTKKENIWRAYKFTKSSDLDGNLRTGPLRDWDIKGIIGIKLEIK